MLEETEPLPFKVKKLPWTGSEGVPPIPLLNSETSPVGVPLAVVTPMFTVTDVPWVKVVGLSVRVVVVVLNATLVQLLTRLATFTEP